MKFWKTETDACWPIAPRRQELAVLEDEVVEHGDSGGLARPAGEAWVGLGQPDTVQQDAVVAAADEHVAPDEEA